jgi:hypothetical protein
MKNNQTAHDSGATQPENSFQAEGGASDFETINPIAPRADFSTPQVTKENYSFQQVAPENQTENLADRAKYFKPSVKTIVDLIDSAGVRALQSTAIKAGWSKEDTETLDERARMQADTYDIIVNSGSRIAARYVKNDEWLDWAALSGGLVQWGVSLVIAIREIKNNPKQVEAEDIEAPEVEGDKENGD